MLECFRRAAKFGVEAEASDPALLAREEEVEEEEGTANVEEEEDDDEGGSDIACGRV